MKRIMFFIIVLVFCMPVLGLAASKSKCQDKVLETKTVEGIYQGNECGDFCYSSVKLDSGKDFAFLCGEDLANKLFGVSSGQRISVTYDVQQFWNEFGNECTRAEVCRSGKIISEISSDSKVTTGDASDCDNEDKNFCEMAECYASRLKKWDAALNSSYKYLMSKLPEDQSLILKKAQIQWVKGYARLKNEWEKEFTGACSSALQYLPQEVEYIKKRALELDIMARQN
mgnify:CR=1 FL=1